jgi:hypothetical protein
MSDVLLYAALKENQKLMEDFVAQKAKEAVEGVASLADYAITRTAFGNWQGGGQSGTSTSLLQNAWEKTLGTVTQAQTNGFKVCDTSGYYRCGANCNWTVPTGVTRARFQSWGPGAGTGSNCCCGGAPFGANGAYTTVEIDVTPGEIFCLCAGCAYCCFAYQTSHGGCGGNTCICSNAGLCWTTCSADTNGCFCKWNCIFQQAGQAELGTSGCNMQVPSGDSCGLNACSGWNFCWDTNADDGCVDFAYDHLRTWAIPDLTSRNGVAYGIPSMFPFMCTPNGSMEQARSCPAPVFGFPELSCVFIWNGNSCFGCNYTGCNNRQGPGGGGAASSVFGGCNSCGGDSGRMGMICVSYECT